jgi:hypothetical protein
MYRIIFNYFHLLPGPSENLPGFVYKDQGRSGGREKGGCVDSSGSSLNRKNAQPFGHAKKIIENRSYRLLDEFETHPVDPNVF